MSVSGFISPFLIFISLIELNRIVAQNRSGECFLFLILKEKLLILQH